MGGMHLLLHVVTMHSFLHLCLTSCYFQMTATQQLHNMVMVKGRQQQVNDEKSKAEHAQCIQRAIVSIMMASLNQAAQTFESSMQRHSVIQGLTQNDNAGTRQFFHDAAHDMGERLAAGSASNGSFHVLSQQHPETATMNILLPDGELFDTRAIGLSQTKSKKLRNNNLMLPESEAMQQKSLLCPMVTPASQDSTIQF